jgi:hypothetical protein
VQAQGLETKVKSFLRYLVSWELELRELFQRSLVDEFGDIPGPLSLEVEAEVYATFQHLTGDNSFYYLH